MLSLKGVYHMTKVRTIDQMYKEIKADDPACALTKSGLRRLVSSGVIPAAKVGNKFLVSREAVERYLEAAV